MGGLIGRVSSSNNGWVDKDLDFFYRYVITSDTDFNVITKPGMYNLYATKSTNNSPGYDYGLLVVFSSGGQILQIAEIISAVGKNVLTFALSAMTPLINLPIP